MIRHLLADAVVVLHLAFVGFVLLGGLLVLRWHRVAWAHLPAALWGVVVEFAGWECPLTPLENWLRTRRGGAGYAAGFVEHYLLPLLYPVALTRELQVVLAGFALSVNLTIYGLVLRRRG